MTINNTQETFLLSHNKGTDVIYTNLLVRIEASSNYCWLHFSNGKKTLTSKTLQWFEESLSSKQFIRVHRTHLVNTAFISQYLNHANGKILLQNGDAIGISRRKRSYFLRSWVSAVSS